MRKKGNVMLLLLLIVALVVGAVFVSKKSQQGSQGPYQNVPLTTGAPIYGGGSTNGQTNANSIPLTLTSVSGAMTVTNPQLVVSGKTVANADVFVNDRDLKADAQGNFATTITLDEGENTINVVVNDAAGNSTEKEFVVTLQ